MNPFASSFQALQQQIADAEQRYGRQPGTTRILAVSKTQAAGHIRAMYELGQQDFGENYLQEAVSKMAALTDLPLVWHFIGRVQSNKTTEIASHFAWVHTVDRAKIAQMLNDRRPQSLPPMNVCVQVNISGEASKSGITPAELAPLLETISTLPHLRLRGLMALPAPATDFEQQRKPFREVARLLEAHRLRFGLDTLSMGTTVDMQAAIAEGATLLRIGTALFGPRQRNGVL